jgi:hypothetical protein
MSEKKSIVDSIMEKRRKLADGGDVLPEATPTPEAGPGNEETQVNPPGNLAYNAAKTFLGDKPQAEGVTESMSPIDFVTPGAIGEGVGMGARGVKAMAEAAPRILGNEIGTAGARAAAPALNNLGMYSKLEQTIASKMGGKASPDEIMGMIKNDVKPDEVKYSGLQDFFDKKVIDEKERLYPSRHDDPFEVVSALGKQQDNEAAIRKGVKIDKNELLAHLEANRLPVQEKTLGGSLNNKIMYDDKQFTPDEMANKEFGVGYNYLDSQQREIIDSWVPSNGKTIYGDYTLPGGKNYRENLYTLSDKTALPPGYKMKPIGALGDVMVTRGDGTNIGTWSNEDAAIRAFKNDPSSGTYQSSHFDEPNILAHSRVNDRVDAQGNKHLFAEEIQSDWHQAGRERGYQNKAPSENEFKQWYEKSGKLTPYDALSDEAKDTMKSVMSKEGVPDAPMKKNWHEFVSKKLLHDAAEGGYDNLSWTTGEQQAERYDLSKKINNIQYNPMSKTLFAEGKGGTTVLDQSGVMPEDLPGIIGKDAASKLLHEDSIISKNKKGEAFLHEISGQDLKVGGEGMKGFYDKMVPDYMGKIGKRFGVKPELTKLNGHEVHTMKLTPEMKDTILKEGLPMYAKGGQVQNYANGGDVSGTMDTPQDLQAYGIQDPNSQSIVANQEQTPDAVNVFNPNGELVSIPSHQVNDAVNGGYTLATDEDIQKHQNEAQYGTPGQQAIAGIEGVAKGIAGPLATGAELAAGVSPEAMRGREEANPWTAGVGEAGGLLGGMFTGTGEAALAAKVGILGAKALLGTAAPTLVTKIGSHAVTAAIENMVIQGSNETSKMILKDPGQTIDTAAVDIGLAGLLGGTMGAGIGAVSPLWHATVGSKVGQALSSIAKRAGGIEGQIPTAMDDVINHTGMTIAPEIRAGLSDDPMMQKAFSTLNQSDTTASGQKLQAAVKAFKNDVIAAMINAFGRTPEEVAGMPEINNYDRGKDIGHTLAKEYSSQIDPVVKEFEDLKGKYKDAPLVPTTRGAATWDYSNPYSPQEIPGTVIPGTDGQIADKIGHLVAEQAWDGSADIMKEVRNTLQRLPKLKTLNDLNQLSTAVGNNTASTLPFGQQTPLSRAGMMLKGILRDAESDAAEAYLGEKAPELVGRYQAARKAYAAQANIKEALDARLGVRGSIGGYAKGLREMANTDGEAIVKKLSGKNDNDILQLLQAKFPQTAEAIKNFHIDSVLQKAVNTAKEGDLISSKSLRKGIDSMDPNLREFVFAPTAGMTRLDPRPKIDAISQIVDKLNSIPNHNFSNTARTMDKLFEHLPSTAAGMATVLTGHGVGAAAAIGYLTKLIGKDAPDAIKLAMLKFLGSDKQISPGAFKSMVDYMHSTVKGENMISSATKNVFKAGREVLPGSAIPSDTDRRNLDKKLKEIQTNPMTLTQQNHPMSHYMPEHAQAAATTAANASAHLNSLRPTTAQASPLDTKQLVDPIKAVAYQRALTIAQQPLTVLAKLKAGTLTPDDVVNMQKMYPDLHTKLTHQLVDQMTKMVHKGEIIPYHTRMGLSMFLGQPLDSTMSPASILAAQGVYAAQKTAATPPQGIGNKGSTKSLQSLPASYQTPGQNREADKQKH